MHAESKAIDWTSKRKDVYGRTRDDLKKSRDPKVRGVAEGFQQMDYKDKAKGTQFEKDYEPKLTKRTHVGRKTGGRIGFAAGSNCAGQMEISLAKDTQGTLQQITKTEGILPKFQNAAKGFLSILGKES